MVGFGQQSGAPQTGTSAEHLGHAAPGSPVATLSVSPFLILFAVFFWSFLWGIPGAFIGVPIVIAILTICEENDSTKWVATLLSGRDDAPDEISRKDPLSPAAGRRP